METFIALIVVGVLMCVYGAFVFAGNVKCSGVAIFLLAIDFWCFGAWSYAQQDDAVRTACLVIGIAAALGVAVLIVLSLKTHADVLKEHHG